MKMKEYTPYLECSWKNMYRDYYELGLFDFIPGPITLSYDDYVALSRDTFY